jgi:hypothetical protein
MNEQFLGHSQIGRRESTKAQEEAKSEEGEWKGIEFCDGRIPRD